MQIIKGKCKSPQKVVVYGPEGIGKTSFAMQFPGAVFCDVEGSTKHYNVARFESITTSWDDIEECIRYAFAHPDEVGTFVLDTADWADVLCQKKACEEFEAKGIEQVDGGYGKGYVYVAEKFHKMLMNLERLLTKGINVVITAHAQIKKIEQPEEIGGYDHWELKCSKKISPMLKEWADMVLFANYKTYVTEDSKTKSKKASGGKRVMYATHTPWWDAKNRCNLPDQMPFEYESIKDVIEGGKNEAPAPKHEEPKAEVKVKTVYEELRELMARDNIPERKVQLAVSSKGAYFDMDPIEKYDEDFVRESLIAKWDKFSKYAAKQVEEGDIPFEA